MYHSITCSWLSGYQVGVMGPMWFCGLCEDQSITLVHFITIWGVVIKQFASQEYTHVRCHTLKCGFKGLSICLSSSFSAWQCNLVILCHTVCKGRWASDLISSWIFITIFIISSFAISPWELIQFSQMKVVMILNNYFVRRSVHKISTHNSFSVTTPRVVTVSTIKTNLSSFPVRRLDEGPLLTNFCQHSFVWTSTFQAPRAVSIF